MRLLLPFSLLLFISSCRQKTKDTLFTLVQDSGITFNNVVRDGQLENSFYFRNFYNGGGVGIGDINNDSLPDVMLTSNMGENKLYLNKGGFKFEDISRSAGLRQDSMWSTGVVMVDINGDGWLDIYECNSGHMQSGKRLNKLYINRHDNTFSEEAAAYGLDISGYCTQSSFFDYDLDGDLDCFIINNSPMPINTLGYVNRRDLPDAEWPVADFLKGGGDHLYRNDNGRFVEVSREAGIHGTLMSFGLGVSVGDVNDDGYPDVYVANDSYERDYLYLNQQDGTFKDDIENCVGQNSFSSMGADIGDINNDGHPDIFTTDMLPGDDYRLKTLGAFDNIDLHRQRLQNGLYNQYMKNCLMVNNKRGQFLETALFSGVSATDWSWGALFFDADNDGFNDIYVCNGVNRDVTNLDFMDFFANDVVQKMVVSGQKQNIDSVLDKIPVNKVPNSTFRNLGNLQFSDAGGSWGLDEPSFSNGAAYGDLDKDGDLDLVVNNENQPAFVYRNNSEQGKRNTFIGINVKGNGQNTFAIGTKIKIYKGAQVFYREVYPSRGFQSSVDYKQIIGLGSITSVDSMVIIWPDQTFSHYDRPQVNKIHFLQQPSQGKAYRYPTRDSTNPAGIFQEMPSAFEKHVEDDFVDFYYERNLPEMLSREGAKIAKADINGDGLEDVYIGGAKDRAGQLYIQSVDGQLVKKGQPLFEQFKAFEDVAVLFFDADEDGDADLYIGAGGNNVRAGGTEIQHRLYKNDGKGIFSIDTRSFPNNNMNISVAANYDYDADGDQDLFVGGRSVPYAYGETPTSYIFQNNGQGHFREVTPEVIAKLGMVTGAVWADVTGDLNNELVVTGQWMATRIFSFTNKGFEELKNTGLENKFGWWQTVEACDINGDGKQDLIIGNIGQNFYLRPDRAHPVKLWVGDFDGSGTSEHFLTRTVGEKDVPVFLKREITEQFPGLKKNNLRHSDFATKSIQDLFGENVLARTRQLQFNYNLSIVAINNGPGTFSITPLPLMVQLSSVNAIHAGDVNGDGKNDLILGGNMFGFLPQFGRLDASYGHVLLNGGSGDLQWTDHSSSGILIKGEVKDIQEIKVKDSKAFIFTQNNDFPRLFRVRK